MKTSQAPSSYDQLLSVYLPLIHRAAHAVPASRDGQTHLEDLLMAGFQGFKEAFRQFPSAEEIDSDKTFSQTIYRAMLRQVHGQGPRSQQN